MTLNTTTAPTHIHMHILDVCLSYHIQAALHVLCPFLCLLTYREGLIQGLNETKLVVLDTQVCIPSTSGQEHCEGWMTQGLTPHTAKNVLRWFHSVQWEWRGEVHEVSFTGSVYLIPFDLKYSVLTSTLLPIQSQFTEADIKEGTTWSCQKDAWKMAAFSLHLLFSKRKKRERHDPKYADKHGIRYI